MACASREELHALAQWLEERKKGDVDRQEFLGRAASLLQLLPTRWDSQTGLRAVLRNITQSTIELIRRVTTRQEFDEIISKHVAALLVGEESLDKPAVAALEMVALHARPSIITDIEPDFFPKRLSLLRDSNMASLVGRLLSLVAAPQAWTEAVIAALRDPDLQWRQNILTYLLPNLVSVNPALFSQLHAALSTDTAEDLITRLQCLQVGKDAQIWDDETYIDLPLLCHADHRVRTAALSLMIEHPKTGKRISVNTMALVRRTLVAFFEETAPFARKNVLMAMRVLLVRLQGSCQQASLVISRNRDSLDAVSSATEYLRQAADFGKWFANTLLRCIQPGSGFQRTFVSLQVMMLCAVYGWQPGTTRLRCPDKLTSLLPSPRAAKELAPLPFETPLFRGRARRLLLERLIDPWADNRAMAIAILESMGGANAEETDQMQKNARSALVSARARDADGAARAMQYVFSTATDHDTYVLGVLDEIANDAIAARDDLLTQAHGSHLHGRLLAVGYMLETYTPPRRVCRRAVDIVQMIWSATEGVLCDDSPEGSNPFLKGYNDRALRGPETQLVLSYCWRGLKEAGNLLDRVLATGNLDYQSVCEAGDLLQSWLLRVRHRGAFSTVEPIFVNLCARLLVSKDEDLRRLPHRWLVNNIDGLSRTRDLTRRSAGIPMSIVAVLIGEARQRRPDSSPLLDEAVDRLLTIAAASAPESACGDLPQVHAMNTLKEIFRESSLSRASEAYVERSFFVAMDGFYSDVWAIRNCSLMLFNATMHRSFGGYFSREHSKVHTLSTRAFFGKYPALADRVEDELETCVAALLGEETVVTTALHPLLGLIARLDLPRFTAEQDHYWARRAKFAGLIEACAASRIWPVRSMAAKALPTLVEACDVAAFAITALNQASLAQQNTLHGVLLQIASLIKYLLEGRAPSDIDIGQIFGEVSKALLRRFDDFATGNDCPLTHAAFLGIAQDFNSTELERRISEDARQVLESAHSAPGREDLERVATSIALSHPTPELLVELIKHDSAIVRLTSLQQLAADKSLRSIAGCAQVVDALLNRIAVETWVPLQLATRDALGSLSKAVLANSISASIGARQLAVLDEHEPGSAMYTSTLLLAGCLPLAETVVSLVKHLRIAAGDAQPQVTRRAALSCLLNGSDDLPRHALVTLIPLLSDDDEELREAAADGVCRRILHCQTLSPQFARERLLSHFAELDDAQVVLALLDLIEDNLEVLRRDAAALDEQDPTEILFEVEKVNQWRLRAEESRAIMRQIECRALDAQANTRLDHLRSVARRGLEIYQTSFDLETPLANGLRADNWQHLSLCLSLA
ncbi:hypothetical protein PYCC9005_005802 [Savitreella phatthalungensis]